MLVRTKLLMTCMGSSCPGFLEGFATLVQDEGHINTGRTWCKMMPCGSVLQPMDFVV